jgi:hypothetical protein
LTIFSACWVLEETCPVTELLGRERKDELPAVDRQEQMIDRFTDWILARDLGAPALLFLEASKPLALIGSQMLLLCQPVLGYIGSTLGWFDDHRVVAEYAELLEDPGNIERLLDRLERRSTE